MNGQSKIRISEIDIRQGDYPYFILTENFPFGTSMLNFALNTNNNLHFALAPDAIWSKGGTIDNKFLNAPNRIHSEKNWEKLLVTKDAQLEAEILKSERQKEIIKKQSEEIIEQSEKLDSQSLIIWISIIFIFTISILTYFIALENKRKRKAIKQIAEKNKMITDSIEYAKLIQEALLPAHEKLFEAFSDGFVYYLPKDIVSGDYYWHQEYGNKSVIAVVDGSGHGVPGAFISMMANKLLRFIISDLNITTPGLVLEKMNEDIKETFNEDKNNLSEDMDIVIIVFDKLNNKLYYSGARRPLILVRNAELQMFNSNRKSIGGIDIQPDQNYDTHIIDTKKGDSFYLLTDGFQDQFNGQTGKKFTRKKLYNLLTQISDLKMSKQKEIIHKEFCDWKLNEEQIDDICIVGLKV